MAANLNSTRTIREFLSGDYAEWLRLWTAYQNFYQASIAEEVSRTTFARMLDSTEPMFGALATSGDRAIGLVHWILHRSNWTIGDYCYLQDLFVNEQDRGAGIGRSLIEHVYADARRKGCSRVYWLTHESNTAAMSLYNRVAERSGFLQYKKAL